MLIALLVPIVLATLVFTFVLVRNAIATRSAPTLETIGLGAVVSFFDTLGIGCFAPTTAWFKFRKLVPDRLIPPTLVVGLTIAAVVESIIFLLQLGVKVDPVLLVGCIIACTTGGLIGEVIDVITPANGPTEIILELAPGVRVRALTEAISRRLTTLEPAIAEEAPARPEATSGEVSHNSA